MELPGEIAALREGEGNPAAMVGEFRRTPVLVPVRDGGLMSGHLRGVRWIYAFTDEAALARFAAERGAVPGEEWEYRTVFGARLLDTVIPELDGPTGIAVDVADADGAMLFPPVRGIVPDASAISTGQGEPGGVPGEDVA